MAAYFTKKTYITIPHSLQFINTSFTLSKWIILSSNVSLNSLEFGLFNHCENQTIGKCSYITIRYGKLLASINGSRVLGNAILKANILTYQYAGHAINHYYNIS
jgi:hypothetical protein